MRRLSLVFSLPLATGLACKTAVDAGGPGFATTADTSTEDMETETGSTDATETEDTETDSETETDTGTEPDMMIEEEGPQVLYDDEDGARGIAVDATHVYWTNDTTNMVQRIEIAGGDPELLADGQEGAYAIAIDATHAYWTNQAGDAVMRIDKDGGEPELLDAAYDPTGIAVDQTDVYWISTVGVYKVAKEGGDGVQLAPNEGKLGGIALSSTHVYWTDHEGWDTMEGDMDPYLEGRIMRISKGGGSASEVVGAQDFPYGIDTDSQYVYWVNNTGGDSYPEIDKVKRAPLGGGPDEDLATMQEKPWAVVVLGDWVYYSTWTEVWKVPRSGGVPTVMAEMQYLPRYVAVDNAHLFWTNGNGEVVKLAFE